MSFKMKILLAIMCMSLFTELLSLSVSQTSIPVIVDETVTASAFESRTQAYDQIPVPFSMKPKMIESGCICRFEHPDEGIACNCVGKRVSEIPNNLTQGVNKISLESVSIKVLKQNSLQAYADTLRDLYMNGMYELRSIENGTFNNLRELRIIDIKRAPKLRNIPNGVFSGFWPNFKILRIVHSGVEKVPNIYNSHSNAIFSMIDFDSNRIKNVTPGSMNVKAESVNLDYNVIEIVENWSFHGSEIAKLSLKGNHRLTFIGEDAFTGLKNLRQLDLSRTSISHLPTQGLENLEVLRVTDTSTLKEFPSVLHFQEIREAHLTYPYHCCAFKFPDTHDPNEFARLQSLKSDVINREHCSTTQISHDDKEVTTDGWSKPLVRSLKSFSNFPLPINVEDGETFGRIIYTAPPANESNDFGFGWRDEDEPFRIGFGELGGVQQRADNINGIGEGTFHSTTASHLRQSSSFKAFCGDFAVVFRNVTCHPEPDAFNPCEDVMGHWLLRICVWIVAIAAMFGNLAVVGVLLMSARMTVSKFLMCHLAVADFCMGLYLLMIASIDIHTKGTYFNYAIHWQHGPGCQVAGFLTVFASELSIFTLTVITLERWYAITYAIHLNRRLQLGTAAKVMALGWLYAIWMACLPLLGISGYSRTSICLPMKKDDLGDLAYLTCLLALNGLAFALVCACYIKMYVSIKASRATRRHHKSDCNGHGGANRASRSDMSVAKRMAMLVFTDFACWTPIAFFGLTAVAGYPLIDLTKSKILLVFFYPLNSCANPFLYAILTKQYRRDVCLICSKYFPRKGKSSEYPPKATGRTLSSNTQQHHKTSVNAIYRGSILNRFHGHRQNSHIRNVQKTHSAILKQYRNASNSVRISLTGSTEAQVHKKREVSPLTPNVEENSVSKAIVHEKGEYLENKHPEPENIDECSSEEDAEGKFSPAVRRGSPHPIKNSYTKLTCPSPEQEIILQRALYAEPSESPERVDPVLLWSTPTKSSTATDATGSGFDNSTSTRDTSV